MVRIPAGPYWTGCDHEKDRFCRPRDRPFKQVFLPEYFIDRYEVTVDDYRRCVQAGGCSAEGMGDWMHCNWGKPDRGNHPINCVSWRRAADYCAWAGKRLPTEQEWEKAARGTDRRAYPWGDELVSCEYAVTNETNLSADKGCGVDSTFPVGSKPKGVSPYGVYDIVGNVWEWTADRYVPALGEVIDDEEPHRVGKGGCWGSGNPYNSRISWSHHYAESYGTNVRLGFRCAMSPTRAQASR